LKYYTDVLSKVKKVLQNLEFQNVDDLANFTIHEILFTADVTEVDYYKALGISVNGNAIILKRNVDEIYTNNYNPEWLVAWNANIDFQVCLDFFSIITYITNYYTKDDTGTVKYLKEASKSCKGKSPADQMRYLANVFLTHRQIGECEAYYRIIPSLHLSDSNIKCIFVASGFPWTRSKFLMKIGEDSPEEEPQHGLRIEGRDGIFCAKDSIQDKYAARPVSLQHMCLAQFAIMYDTFTIDKKKGVDLSKVSNQHNIISFQDDLQVPLPLIIKLELSKIRHLKLRGYPSVMRTHKFKQSC
jgi:hypothetical protein